MWDSETANLGGAAGLIGERCNWAKVRLMRIFKVVRTNESRYTSREARLTNLGNTSISKRGKGCRFWKKVLKILGTFKQYNVQKAVRISIDFVLVNYIIGMSQAFRGLFNNIMSKIYWDFKTFLIKSAAFFPAEEPGFKGGLLQTLGTISPQILKYFGVIYPFKHSRYVEPSRSCESLVIESQCPS